MADHHAIAPRPAGHPAGYRDGRWDGLATLEDRRGSNYETDEPSSAGGRRDMMPVRDQMPELPSYDASLGSSSSLGGGVQHEDELASREERTQRKHSRPRISGGFLLHDKLGGGRIYGSRRQRAQPLLPPRQSQLSSSQDGAFRTSASPDRGRRQGSMPSRRSMGERPRDGMDDDAVGRDARRFSDSHSSQPTPHEVDLDSARIVHMALNLSESRRLAARRNVSRAAPPRLTPRPDPSFSSNLQQHFQQQRRSSCTIPAKPSRGSPPRASSGARVRSSLQPALDATHDAQYRWQFSSSTLARAQTAKEHLELLAQYRRLLDVLPPLKPGLDRPSLNSSPVASPRPASSGGAQATFVTLGRHYNPLQYIRNRKVRARERKVIDGERQGFDDVECVRSWVDTVYRHMSLAGTSLVEGKVTIPSFPGAEELDSQASPEPAAKMRARRPRVDWLMEPCDMIADAYWLEHDGHKYLIEDRHWRKIFPSTSADMSRSISREADNSSTKALPFSQKATEQNEYVAEAKEPGPVKGHPRPDTSHSNTKERARQKLQNIRGLHRWAGNSVNNPHDLLGLKRDSMSEHTDSENEISGGHGRKIHSSRKGTITSNTNDLLQKQMLEMVAKEARERELEEEVVVVQAESADPDAKIPDRKPFSKPSSRIQSRKGSLADVDGSDRKAALGSARSGSPVRQNPDANHSMGSLGNYSPAHNSPVLRPARNDFGEATTSADLSPSWSRSGSPTRNPFSKIKQIMRDKSGESGDSQYEDAEDNRDRRTSGRGATVTPSDSTFVLGKLSGSTLRHYRRAGSSRPRPDEAIGLRGMFKGPRIDTVIRGSVSKLGDMIWKKDGSSESPELETTDESDSDRVRGRQRTTPLSLSRKTSSTTQDGHRRAPKNFLDSMPQFHHAPDHQRNGAAARNSRSPSRQPSQFDLLKPPPQLAIRSPSSSASPPAVREARPGDLDVSEAESLPGIASDGFRHANKPLPSAVALLEFGQNRRSLSRHWSITDRDLPGRTMLSKREVARMRTLILSSGIKAMEIRRRAYEQHKPFDRDNDLAANKASSQIEPAGVPWSDIAELGPSQLNLRDRQVAFCELYPLAAQTLSIATQAWGHRWQSSADHFSNKTAADLRRRVWEVRTRLSDDLSEMTREAADEADETSRDLALGQPLKVKHVVDTMEKMLRKRRRRFRWLRRGLWLTVEWLLVGFMWYVWFMVMVLRIFLGVGRGLWSGVRWLLWL